MHVLVIAGFLALARAQTTIDPLTIETIFETVKQTIPSQKEQDHIFGISVTPSRTGPTQSSEEVKQTVPSQKDQNHIFGIPVTPSRTGPTQSAEEDLVKQVDQEVVELIFGPSKTPSRIGTTQSAEEFTVKPTEGISTFVDDKGQSCQCVPYYMCDSNNVDVDVNNASVTGYGTLDIRFGEDERQCQESVEVCCAIPKDASEVPKPAKPQPRPDPTKVKGCGYSNPLGVGATIAGGVGDESQFGEFPWVVALLDSRNYSYAGVGVLIHPKVVMTGAHIARKYGSGELRIRAGEWDTRTLKEIFPYEERNVQTTIIHENFSRKTLTNDIALLLLDTPLLISEHINVICMPDQDEVFDTSKNCVANGWGKTNFDKPKSYVAILKKIGQDIVPYSRCNTLLKRTRLGNGYQLPKSFVCAGGEAGKDTCKGDGGAPLACPIGNHRYKLTGLVSWGIGCGQKDVPGVYTNVPLYTNWVDDKLAEWGLEATWYRISK